MLIIFNLVGVGLAVSGFVLGALAVLFGGSTSLSLVLTGVVNFLGDIFLRSRKDDHGWGRYFYPRDGGQILFIPSWILGIVLYFITQDGSWLQIGMGIFALVASPVVILGGSYFRDVSSKSIDASPASGQTSSSGMSQREIMIILTLSAVLCLVAAVLISMIQAGV